MVFYNDIFVDNVNNLTKVFSETHLWQVKLDIQKRLYFSLSISADDYLAWYQGAAKSVIVQTEEGQRLQFPAGAIQRYLTHDGIYGRFEIVFDASNKLVSVNKV